MQYLALHGGMLAGKRLHVSRQRIDLVPIQLRKLMPPVGFGVADASRERLDGLTLCTWIAD